MLDRTKLPLALALFGCLSVSVPALAQKFPDDDKQQPQTSVPSQAGNPCSAQPGDDGSQTLTGQLSECGGVINPAPQVDPEIQAPAPDPNPGTTPVIPPDATPEGQNAT